MVLLGLPELVLCCPKLLQACRACFGQPKTSKGIPNLVLCYPKLLQACWACFEQPKTITGLPEPILCCPKLLQACMSLVYVALPTTFTGLLEPVFGFTNCYRSIRPAQGLYACPSKNMPTCCFHCQWSVCPWSHPVRPSWEAYMLLSCCIVEYFGSMLAFVLFYSSYYCYSNLWQYYPPRNSNFWANLLTV